MANTFKHLEIPELILVTGESYQDQRGFFCEVYKQSEFLKNGITENFVQDNFSVSKKYVLRGMHFQLPPQQQGKLVRVVEGKIWDVAVDLRPSSKTFKKWVGQELSYENNQALYIPKGFAHGFLVLSEIARVLYKTSSEYNPKLEQGILWNDSELNIAWPIKNPIVSAKDSILPSLSELKLF